MRPHTRTSSVRRAPRRLIRRPLPLALAAALTAPALYAQDLPDGSDVKFGNVIVNDPVGGTLTIDQTSRGGVINWESFSIGSGGTVSINQPGVDSVTLNRVVGELESIINGTLETRISGTDATGGSVFLINPAGVTFGSGSVTNVGGLVASTLSLGNAENQQPFLDGLATGRYIFGLPDETGFEDIQVEGPSDGGTPAAEIQTSPGGTIALLGNQNITNGGALSAERGSVIMAQGRQITLDFFGDGLTQVTLNSTEERFSNLSISNEGVIQADGGQVLLVSNTMSSSGTFSILNQGQIRAQTLENRAGRIVLSGPNGFVDVGGTLDSTGTAAGQQGGTIEIMGENVQLSGTTSDETFLGPVDILADGAAGGGTIAIDAATNVDVEPGTLLSATSSGGVGGDIDISGDFIQIDGSTSTDLTCADAGSLCTRIDASGNSGGGNITLTSSVSTTVIGDNDLGPPDDDSVQIRADALAAGSGGTITFANDGELDDGAPGSTTIAGATLVSATGSGSAAGGTIDVANAGGGIFVLNDFSGESFAGPVDFIADGASGGGSISLDAATELTFALPVVADLFTLSADATGSGSGGLVRTVAGDILDLRGIEVSAGGPAGAGAWEIQSGRGLAIVANADDFGGNVSLVSDDSIGGALSAGTDVDITVPAAGGGVFPQINIAPDVEIANTGTLPVALSLTAAGGQVLAGIGADGDPSGDWSIDSSAGPLDLSIDALSSIGLFQSAVTTNGGAVNLISRDNLGSGVFDAGILFDGTLDSGGGDIGMTSLASQAAGIRIDIFSTIDTGGGDFVMTSEFSQFTGIQMDATTINTDGGALTLRALDSGGAGVDLNFSNTLDTRVAQNPANASGAILIEGNSRGEGGGGLGVVIRNSDLRGSTGDITIIGRADGSLFNPFIRAAGVHVDSGGEIVSTSGDIDIAGSIIAGDGAGVLLTGNIFGSLGVLSSDSGNVSILGIGSAGGTTFAGGDGVVTLGYSILADGGNIVLSGHGAADGTDDGGNPVPGNGLELGGTTTIASSGGDILLSGSSEGTGAGIFVSGADEDTDPASIDAGGGNIVLRAGNNGSTAALAIDGSVNTTGVVNLRAGEVTAAGAVLDRNASTLQIGGGAGEFVSMDSVANIDTPDLVIGHAGHAGAITIAEALTRAGSLTLQNTGGSGGIALNGAVNLGSGTLALVSGGDITQTAAGDITAQSLLASSTGGSIDLTAAQNDVSGSTLAGGAAGDFGYIDINALAIGNVTARGFDAAGQTATTLAESGVAAADTVFVRNNAGDLTLGADVGGNIIDLVTAGRLQNIAGADIVAGNRWRVWADTWIGEQRGGLAGSGPLPNLFNCSFGGPCGVTVPAADNHFIYRQQPTAVIDIGNADREYGLDNPAFTFGVSGLVFLDDLQANVIAGVPSTLATILSDVGNYTIGGSFASPAGYAIQIDPGVLAITQATLTFFANPDESIYGDLIGVLSRGGRFEGFRNDDGEADLIGTLVLGTNATSTSDVGSYAIFGSGLSSLNYNIVPAAGNATAFSITRATLTYVANPFTLLFGGLFGPFSGTVTGFRNGDTLTNDTTGTLLFSSTVGPDAPAGAYPILGSGLDALNYEFVQDPANFTALRVDFVPPTQVVDLIRETTDTYVYDRNIGTAPMCMAPGPLDGTRQDQAGDELGREWAKVRTRPNLTSCVSSERKNSCGDF